MFVSVLRNVKTLKKTKLTVAERYMNYVNNYMN